MAYQSEIEKLEQRFREKPEQWFAALADAYRKAEEVERALDVVRAGLEKRPNYTSGHIVLGRCLLDQADDREAAKAFERVLELDAENIIALKSLSEIAERQGNIRAARRWLDRLLEVDPMNDEARTALEVLFMKEEPAEGYTVPDTPPTDVESVYASGTVEIEESSGPPEALEAEEAPEEEELELETPELAAQISDEFAVPDFEMEEPVGSPYTGVSEPTIEQERPPEAEVTEVAEPEGMAEPIDMEPMRSRRDLELDVDEAPAAPVSELDARTEEVSEAEGEILTEEPIWGADIVDMTGGVLDATPFDEQLAWDVGERLSHEITEEDVEEARKAHEESVAETAHYLPGLEQAEVPDLAKSADAVEGSDEPGEADVAAESGAAAGPDAEQPPETEAPLGESWAPSEFEVPSADLAAAAPPVSEDAPVDLSGFEPIAEQPEPLVGPEPPPVQPEAVPFGGGGEAEEPAAEEPAYAAPAWPEASDAEPAAERPADDLAPAAPASSPDLPLILPDEIEDEERYRREERELEPEPVVTETMAEVYARQGLFGEARHIYEALLAQRPGDPEIERRIAELDARVTPRQRAQREEVADRFAAVATGGPSLRDVLSEVARARPISDAGLATRDEVPVSPQVPGDFPAPPEAPPQESSVESALGAVFDGETDQAPDVPSSPDRAEVSLASVFGEEPAPAPAPAPSQPQAPGPSPYDEFFGGSPGSPQPGSEPVADETSPDEGGEEQDFRDWLEGLKS